jgi:hypothetical protein
VGSVFVIYRGAGPPANANIAIGDARLDLVREVVAFGARAALDLEVHFLGELGMDLDVSPRLDVDPRLLAEAKLTSANRGTDLHVRVVGGV